LVKGFWYFAWTLIDNHKLVTISFFFSFLKHEKDIIVFCFLRIYVWKTFRIRAYAWKQNIFVFFKSKLILKKLRFFFQFQNLFWNVSGKTEYLNTRSVSYKKIINFEKKKIVIIIIIIIIWGWTGLAGLGRLAAQ
jgi:hypothetical protein